MNHLAEGFRMRQRPSPTRNGKTIKTILVIFFLAFITCNFFYLFAGDLIPFIRNIYSSPSSEGFKKVHIETQFNLDLRRDVVIFLHIQKTGGKTLDSYLVYFLNVATPCYCPKPIPGGCRCRSTEGHVWLYSRLSTDWACGVHADWTELHECAPQKLMSYERKRNLVRLSDRRIYRYITILRDPISRYLSEWLHTQRGADWTTLHRCRKTTQSPEDFPPCHKGLTWVNVTLKDFMACPTNPARNRQTYMLADMREVNCYNLTGMKGHERRERILLSAKRNLRSMPYFALTDFMKDSLFLLQRTIGVTLKSPFVEKATVKADSLRLDQKVMKEIEELNDLDMELYGYAKRLFFLRLYEAQKRAV